MFRRIALAGEARQLRYQTWTCPALLPFALVSRSWQRLRSIWTNLERIHAVDQSLVWPKGVRVTRLRNNIKICIYRKHEPFMIRSLLVVIFIIILRSGNFNMWHRFFTLLNKCVRTPMRVKCWYASFITPCWKPHQHSHTIWKPFFTLPRSCVPYHENWTISKIVVLFY